MHSRSPARWRVLRVAGGAVLAALAISFLLARVGTAELWAAIRQADMMWTLGALASVLTTLALVTARWRVLLAGSGTPADAPSRGDWRQLWDAVVIGQAVNIVFPLRFGEGARVAVTCAALQRPAGGVAVALAFERAADVTAIGLMALLLAEAGWLPEMTGGRAAALLILAVAAIAIVFLFVRFFPNLVGRIQSRLRDDSGVSRWLTVQEADVRTAAATIVQGRRRLMVVVLTVLILLSSISTNLLVFLAFDLPVPSIAAPALLAVLQVGTAVVSVPGNVGVFHYLTVVTLAVWNVPAPLALATATVLHLVTLGPRVLLGAVAAAGLRGTSGSVPASPSGDRPPR